MNYYSQIKDTLLKNEVYKKVKDYSKNKSDLNSYYEVGRLLIKAQGGEERAKYGNKLIKEYSERLTKIGKGYSTRSLRKMRGFYLMFQKWPSLPAKLSWRHIMELLVLKYINYVDENIKESFNNQTVGVVICKKADKYILSYCTNPRIFTTTYKLKIR